MLPDGVKSAIAFILANLFSKGLAIITVPVFTRIMSVEQIGMVNVYNSWFSLISAFSTLSLTSGGFAVALNEFKEERNKYVSSVLGLTTIMGGVCACIVIFFPDYIINLIGLPIKYIVVLLIGLIVSPAYDLWLLRERYEYRYKLAGLLSFLSAFLAAIVSIGAVIYGNQVGREDTAWIRLISSNLIIFVIDAMIWAKLFNKGRTIINTRFWRFSLGLSLPLVGYTVAAQVLSVSDRIMIDRFCGKEEVGIYSTLYSVAAISLMIWTAINTSFVPFLYKNIECDCSAISTTTEHVLRVYSIITVLFVLLSPEIVRILATKKYIDAVYIMPPIACGVYLVAISNLYSNILLYHKKTVYIMSASCLGAGINIILNYLCIPRLGFAAASYTTLVSYAVLAFFEYIAAKKVCCKLEAIYYNKKIFLTTCAVIGGCTIGGMLYKTGFIRYMIGICLIVLFYRECKVFIEKREYCGGKRA